MIPKNCTIWNYQWNKRSCDIQFLIKSWICYWFGLSLQCGINSVHRKWNNEFCEIKNKWKDSDAISYFRDGICHINPSDKFDEEIEWRFPNKLIISEAITTPLSYPFKRKRERTEKIKDHCGWFMLFKDFQILFEWTNTGTSYEKKYYMQRSACFCCGWLYNKCYSWCLIMPLFLVSSRWMPGRCFLWPWYSDVSSMTFCCRDWMDIVSG